MIETIISIALSLVGWIIDRSKKAKLSAKKYVDYIKQWIDITPSAADVADDHDELFNRKIDEVDTEKDQ